MLKGVTSVKPGYTGGSSEDPSYEEVSGGKTGHAEAIQLEFDPSVISYADLLEVFFKTHDPTTLNRQGNDVGTQYRSAVFFHTPEQKSQAEAEIQKLTREKYYKDPIVTQILPYSNFNVAEDYHFDYYAKNPDQMYCKLVIEPKIEKLKKNFKDKLKA